MCKLKKIAFLIIFVTSSPLVTAQVAYDLPRDYIRNSSFNINSLVKGVDYVGSPYLSEEFKIGKILFSGKSITRLIRYNAYTDFFEVKTDENSTQQLSKTKNVSMKMGDMHYQVFHVSGKDYYMANMTPSSRNASLLVKKQIKFKDAVKATTTYGTDKPASFYVVTEYYAKLKDSEPIAIKLKKKELFNILSGHDKELKAFIKSNKLNIGNVEDATQLFNHYNTL